MPKSKSKRKGISPNRPGAAERASRQRFDARKGQLSAQAAAIRLRNALPMGDPLNAHKIASVFDPLEAALREAEADGGFPVDEKNRPLYLDPNTKHGAEWKDMHGAISHMVYIFQLLGHNMKWPEAPPPGLQQLANKMDYGVPMFASDMRLAFDTIAWMRARIATVTPDQFGAALALADKINEEKAAQFERDRAAA